LRARQGVSKPIANGSGITPVRPIVLDFDGAVAPLPDELRIPLRHREQAVRYGCGLGTLAALRAELAPVLPCAGSPVFTGSGDFHHVTLELVRRCYAQGPIDVVVFDNHPDNMRFPLGVHCGSWVRRVALLPFVRSVHVVGITSRDVSAGHAWEHYLMPILRGKLTYWCAGMDTAWAARLGMAARVRGFATSREMIARFTAEQRDRRSGVYLSIDKDVLAREEARTNWDQGDLRVDDLMDAVASLRGRLIACDITGEVSAARYAQRWKRVLSSLDRQPRVDAALLSAWQRQQHAVNLRLLDGLRATVEAAGAHHERRPQPTPGTAFAREGPRNNAGTSPAERGRDAYHP